jgi:hypothetical protein
MSKIEVNTITQQCGPSLTVGGGACKSVTLDATTVTLGRCGATVSLASGATQTGFGRTGTVDWCTTAKTAPFTGVSGKGYFVNTTCAAVTVTLPATPTAGDIISIADYASTFQTNNVTLCNNSSKINGVCATAGLSTQGQSVTLVYVDATRGWKNTMDSTSNVTATPSYIIATGGTITCCGDYKIHTFTADGCFSVSNAGTPAGSTTVDYLVVAGGGSGGATGPANQGSNGGGGAGGFRESSGVASGCYSASPLGAGVSALPVSVQSYPITVGAGGPPAPGGPSNNPHTLGLAGSNSVFSTITSTGGGGGSAAGGGGSPEASLYGQPGGSGGGGGTGIRCGGTGNTPPTSPPQGTNGGGIGGACQASAGGGGATVAGSVATPSIGGSGGTGATTSITGSPTAYAGGGGGQGGNGGDPGGSGGTGGGGAGATTPGSGTAGTTNSGGGGGAAAGSCIPSGAGGSGIVVIRYKFQN